MSGIVGYIGERITIDNPGLIFSMSNSIKYVDTNIVDFWNDNYLSISRVYHGIINSEKQPIYNEDHSLIIFMEGEIYNYDSQKKLLLERGHHFKFEKNDAEFCLHLYEELGNDSFANLNGSFLISIYDTRCNKLVLATDRFSSYPLFYCFKEQFLIFGAQLKAIIQYPKVQRVLNSSAVFEFFTFQRILGNKTYYKDVSLLPPASIITYQNGNIAFDHYWEMNFKENLSNSKEYYIDALSETIKKSVKRRTYENVSYGILLSGGLDSRTVLAASERPMKSFTIADFKNREVEIAKRISLEKGCQNFFINRDPDHYVNIIKLSVELGDGMHRFDHAHFVNFFDLIKSECDILLHGCLLGALFQGSYLPSCDLKIFNKIISLPFQYNISETTLRKAIFEKLLYSLWPKKPLQIFNKNFSKNYFAKINASVDSILNESKEHSQNVYNRFDYFVFSFIFKHFTFLNEICLKHFIEERRIVFDNDLFDLYLEIPPKWRFRGKILKKALEKINPKIAEIPNANTGVPPSTGDFIGWGIQNGKKIIDKISCSKIPKPYYTQGSWPKISQIIRYNKNMENYIWDILNDENCLSSEIFNRSQLIEMFKRHLNKEDDFAYYFYLLITFGTWFRKYGP